MRSRSRSCVGSPPSSDRSRSKEGGWRARCERQEDVETVAVSQAPVVSEASATVAPPVGGATVAALPSAVQDLDRFFLSLAGSSSLGAVGGVAGEAAPASGVGAQLCPSALGGGAVASCAATAMLAGAVDSPAASAAVPAVSSVRRSPARVGVAVACPTMGPVGRRSALGIVPLSLGVLLVTRRSPIGLLRSLPNMTEPRLLLPFLDVCLKVLLAILTLFRRVTARLVLALRAGGRGRPREQSGIAQGLAVVYPAPLGEADDDRSSALVPMDIDWDDSFRSVLALIRNFHSMEEPAGVPSARCKTALASIYELMSETSPAFHLPTSPLMRSFLDDTNLALSKFLEDQTVYGFLPVPSRRHRRYYCTASSSFPGPYSVPPGVTLITLEKASEARKRSVSLSASQISSMETMLSGICKVASWLDWWLSTCGGFRENLPVEVRADFERLILSVLRALEFLAIQGCTALGNLVLSRRDSLLADVRSTVPAEEVVRLRYSPLPEMVSLFPSTLLTQR